MFSKNRAARYDKSLQPVTPYQQAADEWDQRIGSARQAAKNWRMFALGQTLFVGLLIVGLIVIASKGHVKTYVVSVDQTGQPARVKLADNDYQPTEAEIAHMLGQWVKNIRSKSSDPVVIKQHWLNAYNFLGRRAAAALNVYAKKHDPTAHIGQNTRTVHIDSVVQESDHTYQVQWTEKNYQYDQLTGTHSFTGLFTIAHHPPQTQQQVYQNPLGIYITDLNWSADS